MDELIKDRWYWVTGHGFKDDWMPAKHDPSAAGGWTNDDTWEDFEKQVTRWEILPLPAI